MIEIKMPRLSDTMEEGAISTWHKQPGDAVAVGDVLVEIETDKAVMEYEAYQAGTLAEILVPEGQNADIGAPIALLDDGAGGPAASVVAAPAQADSPERNQPTPAAPAASEPVAQAGAVAASPASSGTANGALNGTARQFASPLVRKLARENHLDLSHVEGSGPGGRIIRADISGLLANGAPAPAAHAAGRHRRGRCRRARGRSAGPGGAGDRAAPRPGVAGDGADRAGAVSGR